MVARSYGKLPEYGMSTSSPLPGSHLNWQQLDKFGLRAAAVYRLTKMEAEPSFIHNHRRLDTHLHIKFNSVLDLTVANILPLLSTARYFLAFNPQIATRSGPTERNCKTAARKEFRDVSQKHACAS